MNTIQQYLHQLANRQFKTELRALYGRTKHELKDSDFPGSVKDYIKTRNLDKQLKRTIYNFYTL